MAVQVITNENGKSFEVTGDAVENDFLTPNNGEKLIVKGMLLHGQGNTGEQRIETSSGRILLVLYNSIQGNISPGGRTHIDLDEGESIKLIATGRGVNKSFFGVSVERVSVDA